MCPIGKTDVEKHVHRRHEYPLVITHLKPGEIELTMQEIEDDAGQFRPRMLQNNQVFEF